MGLTEPATQTYTQKKVPLVLGLCLCREMISHSRELEQKKPNPESNLNCKYITKSLQHEEWAT